MTDSDGPRFPAVPGVVLEEEIGRGGYATVYRAHQISVNRKVAVKVDDRRLTDDRDRRRFEREITAAGRVSAHPHMVTLYDGGTTADGRPYLVMELCPGGSYSARMKVSGPVPLAEVLDLGFGIADALVAAHEEGILHRDIKPGNILITRYGTPALGDFGLAALGGSADQPSVTLESLTPSYAPPEAFELRPPTAAGDIYSLGATLYALLQGRPPRSDSTGTPPTIPRLLMLLHDPLPPLDLPGTAPIMSVIWRATAADPAQRYRTATEFRDALAAARLGRIDRRAVPPVVAPDRVGAVAASGTRTVALGDRSGVRDVSIPPTGEPAAAASRRPWRLWPVLVVVAAVAVIAVLAVVLFRGSAGDPVRAVDESGATSTPAPGSSGGSSAVPSARTSTAAPSTSTGPTTASTPPAPPVGACFAGITTIDVERSAAEVPCSTPHYWEAFATGVLSAATTSPYLDEVAADPAVRATCTRKALDQYLGPKRKGAFEIEVLPPRDFDFLQGNRGFRCLTTQKGKGAVTGSLRAGG